MSQLLGRIAKLSSSKGLCFSELRRFSSAATPYLLLNKTNQHKSARTRATVVDINLYDQRKDERVKIPEQTMHKELELSVRIGSSRGWLGVKNMRDFTVRLTNMLNPCASVSSHKVITLPPLDDSKAHIGSISLSQPHQTRKIVQWPPSLVVILSACVGLVTLIGRASRSRFLPRR